jgi:ABC-type Zn2+ transport system substrate-binding protein/surface adhesin
MPHIEAGLALVRMTFDDLEDAADYVCTERDFESANGDDEDEEEEEEEEKKKKEKDEEDEEDEEGDDDDDGAIECLSRQAGKVEQTLRGYRSEFARAVVPARVKLNLTSMIRCFSESVGANVHFFDAWMASRSK